MAFARSIVRRFPAFPLGHEMILVGLGGSAFLMFPTDLAFLTHTMLTGILVLSLALVLGQAGIPSMGQSAMYGAGAYAAALFSIHVSADPVLGLVVGVVVGAAVAGLTGLIVLRAGGMALVMLTIAVAQVILEIANQARAVTGGDDGLAGFRVGPVLGLFRFDFYGVMAFWYVLGALAICYWIARKIVASPFGLTCRAIRSDPGRMTALGCDVPAQRLAVFAIGGAFAAAAGVLLAQTTKVVSLDTLEFGTSMGILVMLVVGGTRSLPGALLGTAAYAVIQNLAANASPHHWMFVIGALLVATLTFFPEGLAGIIAERAGRLAGRRTTSRSLLPSPLDPKEILP